jgi:hypothetical protein
VGVLHLEHRHAVDVLGLEARVLERELDRLDRRVRDRPPDVLGEWQVPDSDDRDPIADPLEKIALALATTCHPASVIGRLRPARAPSASSSTRHPLPWEPEPRAAAVAAQPSRALG